MTNDTSVARDTETRKWWECFAGSREADRRNNVRLVVWALAWAVGLTAVSQYVKGNPGLEGPTGWVLALIPAVLALMVLLAYLRFMRETDELVRRIQRNGMAVGFGSVVMFGMTYAVFEDVGASVMGLEEALIVAVFGYSAGVLIGTWRYR